MVDFIFQVKEQLEIDIPLFIVVDQYGQQSDFNFIFQPGDYFTLVDCNVGCTIGSTGNLKENNIFATLNYKYIKPVNDF